MLYDKDKRMILEVPIDNGDGTFIFTDFNDLNESGWRPSRPWPTTFEGWRILIKYLFKKDLPPHKSAAACTVVDQCAICPACEMCASYLLERNPVGSSRIKNCPMKGKFITAIWPL